MTNERHEAALARKALAEFKIVEKTLQGLLTRARRIKDGADEIAPLRDDLVSLATHLSTYLSVEEEEQLFECLLEKLPEKADEIEALRREHRALEEGAQELIREADTMTGDRARRFGEKVLAFAEAFHRHEDRETELYQRACVRDVGAKD